MRRNLYRVTGFVEWLLDILVHTLAPIALLHSPHPLSRQLPSAATNTERDNDDLALAFASLCLGLFLMSVYVYSLWSISLITLQRTNAENSKQIFPEKELRGHSPNFHIQVSVSDLYIPMIDLPILLQEICGPILGIYKSITGTRMWKLGLRPPNSQKRNT